MTHSSRSRHYINYSTLSVSETAKDKDIIVVIMDLHTPYSGVSFRMTLNDLDQLSKTFNEMKQICAGCRRSLSDPWLYVEN